MGLPFGAQLVLLGAAFGCGGSSPPEPEPVQPQRTTRSPSEVFAEIGPASFDRISMDDAREAAAGSAPRAYFIGLLPVLVLDDPQLTGPDCPRRAREGDTQRFTGGCEGQDGTRWVGEVKMTRRSPESRLGRIELHGFGYEREVDCPDGERRASRWVSDGTFEATGTEEDHRFEISLVFDGDGVDRRCEPFLGKGALTYEGHTIARGPGAVWSGQGKVGWESHGWYEAATTDEWVDPSPSGACQTEALSGETILRSGGREITLRYDGDLSCEEEGLVPWMIDGEPQTEPLIGVHCAAGAAPPWLSVGLLLGLLALRRTIASS